MLNAETHKKPIRKRKTVTSLSENSVRKIAYIMSRFPKLTETFILYEMEALEKAGVKIELFPLLKEKQKVHHAEVNRWLKIAHFHPFISITIIKANWHFIVKKPKTYLELLAEILKGTLGSLNFFIGAIGIFPKAVCFALEMEHLNIQYIHAHFANHPALAGFIINRLTNIPFGFTAHGSDLHVERRMLDKKVEAALLPVTISQFNKEVIIRECGEGVKEKIRVIHCGVDTKLFYPKANTSEKDSFDILCVASFEEVKGHKYLVEACKILYEKKVIFICHLVGYGPLRKEIEQQIRNLGLENSFKIYGGVPRSEVIKMYSLADVFVLPSVPTRDGKKEGIPVVLMEAMASGVPVVSSEISGIPELVKDGRSGFLTPPGDSNALAKALERLWIDNSLRRQMGKKGRKMVLQKFDLEKNALQLLEKIKEVYRQAS